MPIPDTYRAVVLDQQAKLQALIKAEGVAPIRRMYEDMLEAVTGRLNGTAGTFTEVQLRGMQAQLRLGMAGIVREMTGSLNDSSYEVGIAAARQSLEDVSKLERHFTGAFVPMPLLEVARLRGLVNGEASSMFKYHKSSMLRYGAQTVSRFELSLQRSLASGMTGYEAIDSIHQVGETSWYGAERIVRTELSYAANKSIRSANDAQAAELDGDLWMRWSEHVSDAGAPLDDRVGEDSEAMNGQVAPPGESFTQPPLTPRGEQVSESLVGESWLTPPNRPNDRAVLTPWRFHWGVPGWLWRDGRRQHVTQKIADEINGKYNPPADVEREEDRQVVRPQEVDREPEPVATPMPDDIAPDEEATPAKPARASAFSPRPPPDLDEAEATANANAREVADLDKVWQAAAPPSPEPTTDRARHKAGVAARREAREAQRALREAMAPPKNPKRVAAAKVAAEASAERLREIHSAVKSNLSDDLHIVWDKEGHKFLKQEAGRIRGIKNRIDAASKISEAFSETYGSGELGGAIGNEGDRFYKRTEIEVEHFEARADELERKHYEEMRLSEIEAGRIDAHGNLIGHGHESDDEWAQPKHHAPKPNDDDPPF